MIYFSYSNAQHNVLDWQRHAARRMIHHYLEVDMFYQVGLNRIFVFMFFSDKEIIIHIRL